MLQQLSNIKGHALVLISMPFRIYRLILVTFFNNCPKNRLCRCVHMSRSSLGPMPQEDDLYKKTGLYKQLYEYVHRFIEKYVYPPK